MQMTEQSKRLAENYNAVKDSNGDTIWVDYEYTKESHIAAAEKYADAIADTCAEYNIDGFDADLEDWGTLIRSGEDSIVLNSFFRKLIERFEPENRWLVLDIPGGTGWLSFYDIVSADVLEKVKYICWQTYELEHAGLDNFFDAVKRYKYLKKCFQNLSSPLHSNVLRTNTSSLSNRHGDIAMVCLMLVKVHTTLSMTTRAIRTIHLSVKVLVHRILRSTNNHI